MRTLFQIIQDVLSDKDEIQELPNNELWALQPKDEVVQQSIKVSAETLIRIARLQTLYVRLQNDSKIPKHDDLKSINDATGQSYSAGLANSMATSQDSVYAVIMLKRLIIELIRSDILTEQEVFGSEYIAAPDNYIYRVPGTEYIRPLLD